MKNICFPTDFSELSLKALPIAIGLAKRTKAELHILHVMKSAKLFETEKESLVDFQQRACEEKFLEIKEKNKDIDSNVKLHFTSLHGNIIEKIKKYSKNNAIDLIVLSTHGYSGIKNIFMGSTTYKLIQNLHIPIFSINPNTFDSQFDIEKVKNILFPTDFSENGNQALDLAAHLANTLGASLTLFHALSDFKEWVGIYGDAYSIVGHFGSYQGYLTEQKEQAQKDLDQLKRKILSKYLKLDVLTKISEGAAEKAIVSHCKYNFETIIVMSTHGYSGIDHLLMGSVAQRVIQTSIEPVVTLNPAIENIPQPTSHKLEGEIHESV